MFPLWLPGLRLSTNMVSISLLSSVWTLARKPFFCNTSHFTVRHIHVIHSSDISFTHQSTEKDTCTPTHTHRHTHTHTQRHMWLDPAYRFCSSWHYTSNLFLVTFVSLVSLRKRQRQMHRQTGWEIYLSVFTCLCLYLFNENCTALVEHAS